MCKIQIQRSWGHSLCRTSSVAAAHLHILLINTAVVSTGMQIVPTITAVRRPVAKLKTLPHTSCFSSRTAATSSTSSTYQHQQDSSSALAETWAVTPQGQRVMCAIAPRISGPLGLHLSIISPALPWAVPSSSISTLFRLPSSLISHLHSSY